MTSPNTNKQLNTNNQNTESDKLPATNEQVHKWTTQPLKQETTAPIKPHTGRKRSPTKQYTQQRAERVLAMVKSTTLTLPKIAHSLGFQQDQIYCWLASYPEFAESFALSLETRAHVYQDDIKKALDSLDMVIDDPDMDVREKHVRANVTAIKIRYMQWLSERINRRVYGQLPQTVIIGADPVALREQAWRNRAQEVRHGQEQPEQ